MLHAADHGLARGGLLISGLLDAIGSDAFSLYHLAPSGAGHIDEDPVAACGERATWFYDAAVDIVSMHAAGVVRGCPSCLTMIGANMFGGPVTGAVNSGAADGKPIAVAGMPLPLGVSRVGIPPESPISAALRAEMLRQLEGQLPVQGLRRLGRTITASIKVLQATATGVDSLLPPPPKRPAYGNMVGYPGQIADPDAVDLGEEQPAPVPSLDAYAGMGTYAPAPPIETLGTNAFREVAGGLMKYLEQKDKPKPPSLVDQAMNVEAITRSLAAAKKAELSDKVIARLEAALEKALGDGSSEPRTIHPRSVVVTDSSLGVESPSAPQAPGVTVRACSVNDVNGG